MATTSAVKPQLPALKTPLTAPLSATYPSELRSPAVATPTYIKREDAAMKTPITPPPAYLDFLTRLSPTLASPYSAGPTSASRFTFDKPLLTSSTTTSTSTSTSTSSDSVLSTASSGCVTSPTGTEPATTSRPASPHSSVSSRSSSCSSDSKKSDTPVPSSTTKPVTGPAPPVPFNRHVAARTPRRLHIPQSPYSPASVRSPLSASSLASPYSATMSPREWNADKEPLSASSTRTVSVRQVVRRTVQYSTRAAPPTPIVEPVPASKKRKAET